MTDPDTTVDGRPAHSACVRAYNSTIACGDHRCCLSERYDGPPSDFAVLCRDLTAAWRVLPREERAARLGQPLTEREDGMCVRRSHDDGVQGSGLWGHVEQKMGPMLAALAALRGEQAAA